MRPVGSLIAESSWGIESEFVYEAPGARKNGRAIEGSGRALREEYRPSVGEVLRKRGPPEYSKF